MLYIFHSGVPFPRNFLSIAKTILKRLFRVYAHIYHQHFPEVVQLGEEAHLNTSFKHFIYFVQVTLWNIHLKFKIFYHFDCYFQEFSLIDRRELAPLQELIDKLANKEGRWISNGCQIPYHSTWGLDHFRPCVVLPLSRKHCPVAHAEHLSCELFVEFRM